MQRFVSAWHDRCIRAEDIAAADANERLMLQRNGTTFRPSPRVLARPLETAGPRTRPEMAHAPRGKHLWISLRVSHVVGPAMFDCVDRYVSVDVRPVRKQNRRPSNGPARGAFPPLNYAKARKALFDCLQSRCLAKQDRQALCVKALVRHGASPWLSIQQSIRTHLRRVGDGQKAARHGETC